MRKLTYFPLIILLFLPSLLIASNPDSSQTRIGVGADVGFSQSNTLTGDIYGGAVIPIGDHYAEANLGYLFFRNETEYAGIDEIKYESRGIYLEANAFFIKGLYAGFRYSITFNWVDDESQERFNNVSFLESPEFFLGQTLNFQSGYLLELNDNLSLRFQGQIGLHSFEIAEGEYWQLGGTDDPMMRERFRVEDKLQLIYNLSLGFTYRIDADIY